MNPPSTDRNRLWDLIKDTRFAMFTSRDEQGVLRARPMTTQNHQLDEDASLWFFMSRSGPTATELQGDALVNVAYADTDADSYVSVAGEARLVEDMAKKQQLWSKMTEAWFPKGVQDPDLALVQVRITYADYWDVKDNKVTQLFKMAKAAVTGKPPQDMGEHGHVQMR